MIIIVLNGAVASLVTNRPWITRVRSLLKLILICGRLNEAMGRLLLGVTLLFSPKDLPESPKK